MATIRKIATGYRAEVRKKGQYHSANFPTKGKAQAWASDIEKKIAKGLGREEYTLADALDKYQSEVSPTKKGERQEKIFINALLREPIAPLPLSRITPMDIGQWRDKRLKEVSAATVRRQLTVISSVFQAAILEWRWCEENPVRSIRKPASTKPRDRRPTADEIDKVVATLGFKEKPPETKSQEVGLMFLLAIESAMRLGEMCSLQSENIHLKDRYVTLLDTKNGDSRDVPLSRRAVELLELSPEGFAVNMEVASALFRKACVKAKIEDLHFHDSRREGLTRLSEKVDIMQLARISGHRDTRTLFQVYYAPKAKDLATLLD